LKLALVALVELVIHQQHLDWELQQDYFSVALLFLVHKVLAAVAVGVAQVLAVPMVVLVAEVLVTT
jgi:hypothetical protein